jgi:hypothetical protein
MDVVIGHGSLNRNSVESPSAMSGDKILLTGTAAVVAAIISVVDITVIARLNAQMHHAITAARGAAIVTASITVYSVGVVTIFNTSVDMTIAARGIAAIV